MSRPVIILVALSLVALGIATRLLPHLPNATPLTAIALVSSLYLGSRWYALALPGIALTISDAFIGGYDWRIMASVYLSFTLAWAITATGSKRENPVATGVSLSGSSLLFFFVTNGAVWLFSPWYEKSVAGLLYAYELGFPFLRNMFLGDIFYSILLVVVSEGMLYLWRLHHAAKSRVTAFLVS